MILCGLSAGSLCWFAEAVSGYHGEVNRVPALGFLPLQQRRPLRRRRPARRLPPPSARRDARRLRRRGRRRAALRRRRAGRGRRLAARGPRLPAGAAREPGPRDEAGDPLPGRRRPPADVRARSCARRRRRLGWARAPHPRPRRPRLRPPRGQRRDLRPDRRARRVAAAEDLPAADRQRRPRGPDRALPARSSPSATASRQGSRCSGWARTRSTCARSCSPRT